MRPLTRWVRQGDPAPSRLAYRMERLMLTPLFRVALRLGVPLVAVVAAGAVYFSDAARREAIVGAVANLRHAIESRPEFRVDLMAIDGASAGVAADIREILQVDFPTTSFDLDLDAMRAQVLELSPVEAVALRIRPGGILQVDVTERVPAVVWRHRDGLDLLDAGGALVHPVDSRAARADLPLVAGEGADAAVAEALVLVAAARPLHERFRGLVRVGERRWDVVLDRGQRILLPPTGARRALERAIAMDQAEDLFARDVAAVDMRLPARPTIRLNAGAVEELRRIRALQWGEE